MDVSPVWQAAGIGWGVIWNEPVSHRDASRSTRQYAVVEDGPGACWSWGGGTAVGSSSCYYRTRRANCRGLNVLVPSLAMM